MRQTRWLIAILLAGLVTPPPGLASTLLATSSHPASPSGGKQPPQLRGRNRIGDLPVARCVTDEAPRRDPRRRERSLTARLAPTQTAPRPRPDSPGATPRIALHLRC